MLVHQVSHESGSNENKLAEVPEMEQENFGETLSTQFSCVNDESADSINLESYIPKKNAHFFFIVNPKSGDNEAGKLLELNKLGDVFEKGYVNAFDVSLCKNPNYVKDISNLFRDAREKNCEIYVIIAGGDGTFTWAINILDSNGIHSNDIIYSILPYGTGNDLARFLNSPKLKITKSFDNKKSKNFNQINELISKLLESQKIQHSIWKVSVHLDDELPEDSNLIDPKNPHKSSVNQNTNTKKSFCCGLSRSSRKGNAKKTNYFSKIDDVTRKFTYLKGLKVEKYMSNYFSIGIDSKIGVNFDKNRTKSFILNKCVYFNQGLLECMFRKHYDLRKIIKSFGHLAREDDDSSYVDIFRTDQPIDNLQNPTLLDAQSIVCLNIDSFAAGIALWKSSKTTSILTPTHYNRLIEARKKRSVACNCYFNDIRNRQFFNQSIDTADLSLDHTCESSDNYLEWLSVGKIIDIPLSKILLSSNAHKICSKPGPFQIKFHNQMEPVYFEIDGEFYKAMNPNRCNIELYRQIRCAKL